jgi:N-acetylmuramoyl-L-alanine amidase
MDLRDTHFTQQYKPMASAYGINRACKAPVMIPLRHLEATLLFAVSIMLALADPPAAQSRAHRAVPTKLTSATCQRSAFRVVLDVGHTIAAPGAMSARGVAEYQFNLHLVQDVYQTLVDHGFADTVVLLTNEAPPLGLYVRANHANAMRGDLFIAIHHDSVPDNLLQTWQYEGQEQHYNDQFPGYAIFISNENADLAGSLQFGKLLGQALQLRGLGYTPHYTLALMGRHRRQLIDAEAGVYRYDALVVLQRARMPAVLLEAGSIVNRQEELELASPERRALVSAAVVAAVEDFCAARPQPKIGRAIPVSGRGKSH